MCLYSAFVNVDRALIIINEGSSVRLKSTVCYQTVFDFFFPTLFVLF